MITKQARQRIEEETKERIEVRRKAINEKCGQPKDLNDLSDGKITILNSFYLHNIIIVLYFFILLMTYLFIDRSTKGSL